MALLETNPTQLQHVPGTAAPLFLIHDGGGTIFKYFLLGNLGRNVYGIQDPKFESDDGWEGGLAEMAQEYITLIKQVKSAGPIFLGGWSLGGLVSLQIARILDDERRHVHTENRIQPLYAAGIILIDSPYTPPWREYRDRFIELKPEFPAWTPQWVRENVIRRFEVCDELLDTWEAPRWDVPLDFSEEDMTLQVDASGSTVERATKTEEALRVRPVALPPHVVLLKAVARVPLKQSKPDGLLDVDLFRDETLLGWERYPGDLLETTHHISGHHFDLFDHEARVKMITNILKETCAKWENSGL